MRKRALLSILLGLLLAACGQLQVNIVPTTGDTALDAAAAQSQLPNLSNYGYTSIDASSITEALTAIGGGSLLVSGNPAGAAAIAKLDDMMRCYQSVGAVAAQVYAQADLNQLLQGEIPKVGALGIINRDRLGRNLLPCALNTGQGFSAQAAQLEPCGGAGSFIRHGETFDYVYAATDPQLCTLFAAALQ